MIKTKNAPLGETFRKNYGLSSIKKIRYRGVKNLAGHFSQTASRRKNDKDKHIKK
jgi:hypothetical protein